MTVASQGYIQIRGISTPGGILLTDIMPVSDSMTLYHKKFSDVKFLDLLVS